MFWKLTLRYNGTHYLGWQKQRDQQTVQFFLEKVLTQIFNNEKIICHGSGRTDSGVHALGQVVSFSTPRDFSSKKLLMALNSLLPDDISVSNIQKCENDFHARFDCIAKTYFYIISKKDTYNPFTSTFSWKVKRALNIKKMIDLSSLLIGEKNFSSFAASKKEKPNPVREIYNISFSENEHYLGMSFTGNGFLYKMVRTLASQLMLVGAGDCSKKQLTEILNACDRTQAAKTAPAKGLFLGKVYYTEKEMQSFLTKQEQTSALDYFFSLFWS